jgi:hypothetical protein
MQRLADLLDAPVDCPMIQETTALGAAYLAGLATAVYLEPTKFADNWRLEHRSKPAMSSARPRARSGLTASRLSQPARMPADSLHLSRLRGRLMRSCVLWKHPYPNPRRVGEGGEREREREGEGAHFRRRDNSN